jgi:hypothetical protein
MKRIALALVIAGLAFGQTACPEKGTAQKAGEKIDDALDKLKHPNEGPMEKAGRKMDEDYEKAKEAVKGDK